MLTLGLLVTGFGCTRTPVRAEDPAEDRPEAGNAAGGDQIAVRPQDESGRATFAGGCFWCMEEVLDEPQGVSSTTSGYTGGDKVDPTYEEVSSGGTGHAEAVQVVYDPARVSYEELLELFWVNVDPTVNNRQFCDTGRQYRPAIFYHDETQKRLAEESRDRVQRTKTFAGPILVEISPASEFYPAEDYHQDFYEKSPLRYKLYKFNCGRTKRLEQLWGKHADGRATQPEKG
ncbi:MAG: peptide-methionine (S)-S-oxide reductase MsrA [Gemmatimonadetes bacterium]|nr:peptide-methionine (S)-S-oxide reductase MsrA [Gemmatimonadota bacterium]